MVGYASGQHAASIAKRGKPIPRKRAKPRRGPVVDRLYCDFVRCFGCIACTRGLLIGQCDSWDGTDLNSHFQRSLTECAHVGRRGLSQRCSDRETLPLCRGEHHQHGPESHHVLGKRFWTFHALDRRALIAELNRLYELESGPSRSPKSATAEQHGQATRRKR